MKINAEVHRKLRARLTSLENDRRPWWEHWRTLADYYLPKRYIYLLSAAEMKRATSRNEFILDNTGTLAARTCSAGMMNGITSPSRPWFRLSAGGFQGNEPYSVRLWLDIVAELMLETMAETNFYNAMATMYLDLAVFGTSATLIYEDFDDVFRCYNSPLGEFYIAQSDRGTVNTFSRVFSLKVHQVVEWFGLENCSVQVKDAYNARGARLSEEVEIGHLIEPNLDGAGQLSKEFKFREYYWETKAPQEDGNVLKVSGFFELPGVFPRWELVANDAYGSSPGMDALGDVVQLQKETMAKAKGLDKTISPPILADIQLQHRPTALLPNGVTYVAGVNNVGVKPLYQIQLPLDQITLDIREIQGRIRETFHNDLFKMISQLDTVRSATEIDARREEKLILLGPFLERFENEALDPFINRVYSIMSRAGLLPPPPPELEGASIEIQYVSVLTAAQTAVAALPTERFLQVIGNVSAVYQNATNIPEWDTMLVDYGRAIGVKAKHIKSLDQIQQINAQQAEMAQAREAQMQVGATAETAKVLSETELTPGSNALAALIGG